MDQNSCKSNTLSKNSAKQHTYLNGRFVDKLKYGRWVWGDWNPERSPDPVQDFDGFCENIKNAFSRPRTVTSFKKKPICEALLDQDYFNGIGNYLRAEILYHANIHVSSLLPLVFSTTNISLTFFIAQRKHLQCFIA